MLTPAGYEWLSANPTVTLAQHVANRAVTPVPIGKEPAVQIANPFKHTAYTAMMQAAKGEAVTPTRGAVHAMKRGWLTEAGELTDEGRVVLTHQPLATTESMAIILGVAVTPQWECNGVFYDSLTDIMEAYGG